MSPPSRRSFVAAAASIATASLAGCSSPLNQQPTSECDPMHRVVIKTEQVSLSPAKREEVHVIQYSNLSEGEREVVRTATEGQYRRCDDGDRTIPESHQSFINRVSKHTTENRHAFIRYNGTTYAVAVRVGDLVITDLPHEKTITQDQ